MTAVATCPQCTLQLSVPDEADADSLVKCPVCRATFELRSVRLSPMLTMIVVPAPPPSSPPSDHSIDELISPLPSAPELESAPGATADEDLTLQDDLIDEEELPAAEQVVEPLLDPAESLHAVGPSSSSDELDAGYAGHDGVEAGEIDEPDEDHTPLENPDPTEFDEVTQEEFVDESQSVETEIDEVGAPDEESWSLAEEPTAEVGVIDLDEQLADHRVTDEPPAEVEDVVDELRPEEDLFPRDEDEAAAPLQTETLELESDAVHVPVSSHETIRDVPLSGALPDDVRPLYSAQEELEPADEIAAFTEPYPGNDATLSEMESSEVGDATDPLADLQDSHVGSTAYQSTSPSESSESSESGDYSQLEPDAVEPSIEPTAPPIDLDSWRLESMDHRGTADDDAEEVEKAAEIDDASSAANPSNAEEPAPLAVTAEEWPPQADAESAYPVDDQQAPDERDSDFTAAPEPAEELGHAEPVVEESSPSAEEFAEPDGDAAEEETAYVTQNEDLCEDQLEAPIDSTEVESNADEDSAVDQREPVSPGDRHRHAQIPLPGFDRPDRSSEKSWFSSWMILLAVIGVVSVLVVGFGLMMLMNPDWTQPKLAGSNSVADGDESDMALPNNAVSGDGSHESEIERANYESPTQRLADPRTNEPTDPFVDGGPMEPGAFPEPEARPLSTASGVVNAPTYSMDELSLAFQVAEQAQQGLLQGDQTTKADSYVYFCDLAEKLTFVADEPKNDILKMDAKDIFRRVVLDRNARRDVAQLANMWLNSPTRLENSLRGIFVVGTLVDIQYRNGPFEYFVDGGVGEPFRFVLRERLDQRLFPKGELLVAAGSIIDNPRESIIGYDGDAEQTIWAGVVKPVGRPTDAPTDSRLNFHTQK